MEESKKEFLTALFAFLYLGGIAYLLSINGQNSGDMGVYRQFAQAAYEKHPLDAVKIYAAFAWSAQLYAFMGCFLPSLALVILARLISSRRGALLFAVGLPLAFYWALMAEILCILFFIVAIAAYEKKSLLPAGVFFALGALSHRYGVAIGILIWAAYGLAKNEEAARTTGRLALLAFGVVYLAVLITGLTSCLPFGRSLVLIGLPVWILFVENGKGALVLLFAAIMLVSTFYLFATGNYSDANRIALIAQPVAFLGLALSKAEIKSWLLLYLLIAGMGVVLYSFPPPPVQQPAGETPLWTWNDSNSCRAISVFDVFSRKISEVV